MVNQILFDVWYPNDKLHRVVYTVMSGQVYADFTGISILESWGYNIIVIYTHITMNCTIRISLQHGQIMFVLEITTFSHNSR